VAERQSALPTPANACFVVVRITIGSIHQEFDVANSAEDEAALNVWQMGSRV